MLKFPSIEQLYKNLHVVDYGEVVATEKLHGTNARIEFIIGEGGMDYRIGSRNEEVDKNADGAHMGFVGWAKEHCEEFQKAVWATIEVVGLAKTVTFFGEWCGKGIQKGVHYYDGKTFYLFAIAINRYTNPDENHFLSFDERIKVAEKSGLKHVPCLFRGNVASDKAIETFDAIIKQHSKVAEDNNLESVMEGVVIEPAIPKLNHFNVPIIVKHKNEKFMEVKKEPRVYTPTDELNDAVCVAFCNVFVTDERLNHIIDKAKERNEIANEMGDMKVLPKYMVEDIEKECADACILVDAILGDRKKLNKMITRRVANMYDTMLRANIMEAQLNENQTSACPIR